MRVLLSILCAAWLLAGCSTSGCPRAGTCGGGQAGTSPNPITDAGAAARGDSDGGNPSIGTGAHDAGKIPAPGAICTHAGECEEHIAITSANHVSTAAPIAYPDPPPAGGNHDACWGAWGVHDTPLPARNWVHNLEHGGIVLLHNCPRSCSTEVADLTAFVAAHPRTILTEYTDMPARFAAVAWGYRLLMSDLDLDVVAQFYLAHFDRAPESIDASPPTGCSN